MKMGVFRARVSLEREERKRMLGHSKRWIAGSSRFKMTNVPLAGRLAKTRLPDLSPQPWTQQTGGSSLDRQRQVCLQQLCWPDEKECRPCMSPDKWQIDFHRLSTRSLALLKHSTSSMHFRGWPTHSALRQVLLWNVMMTVMLHYYWWECWPVSVVGEAYPDTCFQLAGLLHVNDS